MFWDLQPGCFPGLACLTVWGPQRYAFRFSHLWIGGNATHNLHTFPECTKNTHPPGSAILSGTQTRLHNANYFLRSEMHGNELVYKKGHWLNWNKWSARNAIAFKRVCAPFHRCQWSPQRLGTPDVQLLMVYTSVHSILLYLCRSAVESLEWGRVWQLPTFLIFFLFCPEQNLNAACDRVEFL